MVILSAFAGTILFSCAPARQSGQGADLVIYTSHPDDLARTVIDEFRERTGLRVHTVSDGTGALLERLGAENGSGADVLWGGGAESLVANIRLFVPYLSPERTAIPASLRDSEGFWTGFTVLPMVIIVNTRLVRESDIPRRWSEVMAPSFAGSVAFADPSRSGSSYTILRTILVAMEEAEKKSPEDSIRDADEWRIVRDLVRAIGGVPLEESALVYRGVASGEYLVGMTYENAGADSRRLGSDVRVIYPGDGTSAVPDGVAMLHGAPHEDAAKQFIDFVLGQDVARVVSARFGRRSARSDAPVPDGLPSLDTLRLVNYDFDAAVSTRAVTIERFSALCGSP